MSRINTTKYALLGMLAFKSATGYDIKKAMQQTTDYFWSESDGAIYPILKQLLAEGLVICTLENEQSGRSRKVYTITTGGKSELEEWLDLEPLIYQGRNELLLKVFFGEHTTPGVTIRHIEKFRLMLNDKLKGYEKILQNFSGAQEQEVYRLLTLKAGILSVKAKLQWCEEALHLLQGNENESIKYS